jgi:hypothetical protein
LTIAPALAPAASAAAVGPQAPASVSLAQGGTLPDLKVNWVYASKGGAATGALVQLLQVSGGTDTYLTSIRCGDCTTTTFRSLSAGATYAAKVYPIDDAGEGTPTTSAPFSIQVWCLVGACVSFDATTPLEPAGHQASGLLESLFPEDQDQQDLRALGTTIFRGTPPPEANGTFNWSSFEVATADGAQTLVVLDDLQKVEDGGNPPTPWSDWAAYSNWVKTTAQQLVASGKEIDYWEIYNEPGGNDKFYSDAGYASETPALLLQQFQVAYGAIKSVDPAAQIVGPDLPYWTDYPGQYGNLDHSFDMVTFLNFAAANHIELAALTWHEIVDNFGPAPEENSLDPAILEDHVADARALIAARPALGHPKIFIDEYGIPEVQKVPGWDVAYLSALTNAGVDSGIRACWYNDCTAPTLDGLLYTNGKSPLPEYYERLFYEQMSGTMVTTTSSSDSVTAVGSFNPTTQTLTGLVGRGVGCSQNLLLCPSSFVDSRRAQPTSVSVTITVPWTSGVAHIALSDISGANPTLPTGTLSELPGTTGLFTGALGQLSGSLPLLPPAPPKPKVTSATITPNGMGGGQFTISIPTFADGDAYGFNVTH